MEEEASKLIEEAFRNVFSNANEEEQSIEEGPVMKEKEKKIEVVQIEELGNFSIDTAKQITAENGLEKVLENGS